MEAVKAKPGVNAQTNRRDGKCAICNKTVKAGWGVIDKATFCRSCTVKNGVVLPPCNKASMVNYECVFCDTKVLIRINENGEKYIAQAHGVESNRRSHGFDCIDKLTKQIAARELAMIANPDLEPETLEAWKRLLARAVVEYGSLLEVSN